MWRSCCARTVSVAESGAAAEHARADRALVASARSTPARSRAARSGGNRGGGARHDDRCGASADGRRLHARGRAPAARGCSAPGTASPGLSPGRRPPPSRRHHFGQGARPVRCQGWRPAATALLIVGHGTERHRDGWRRAVTPRGSPRGIALPRWRWLSSTSRRGCPTRSMRSAQRAAWRSVCSSMPASTARRTFRRSLAPAVARHLAGPIGPDPLISELILDQVDALSRQLAASVSPCGCRVYRSRRAGRGR